MRVFKNAVPIDDNEHSFKMPEGEILFVAEQHGAISFWFESPALDPSMGGHLEDDTRTFRVFGTGHIIPEGYLYQGTAMMMGGNLVVHLYEVIK